MSQSNIVPVKLLKIGTYEKEDIEIWCTSNSITFPITEKINVEIRKQEVSSLKLDQECNKTFKLYLRPSKIKEISECLPEGYTFSIPKQIGFFIELKADETEEQNKIYIDNIFNSLEKNSQALDSLQDINKSIVDDDSSDEYLPPHHKKSKSPRHNKVKNQMLNEHENESIRSLRSERRRKNVKNSSNKFSMDDFYEGDEIPQQLLSENEQMLDVCDDKTDHKAAMSILDFYDDARELLNYRNTLISMEDYKSLQYSGLLTNGVIDFYLQYVYHELLSEEMQAKIHICSVDFYSSYAIDPNFSGWKSDGSKAVDKRYNFVKDIPSNQFLNFFEKDFIVFPCNVREHWLLAIVCYPKLNGVLRIEDGVRVSLEEAKRNIKDPSAGKPVKQSCILIFDSVKKSARSTVVIQHLRNFFGSEYKAKYGRLFEFSAVNLFGASLKVPYQDNATDCGLFLLEFFEHFFIKSPIEDYRLPLQLDNWFDSDIILDKREQIATVIKSLMVTLHPGQDILSELPPLKFHADTMDIETINLEEDKNLVSNNNEETFNNNNDFNVIDKHKSEESDTLLTVEDANAQE